jgi:hypothetical protein
MRHLLLVLFAAGCFPLPEPPAQTMTTTNPMPDGGPPAPPADLAGAAHTTDLAGGSNPTSSDLATPPNPTPDMTTPPNPSTPPFDLTSLSDTFENGFQSSWNTLHPTLVDVSVSSSALALNAHQSLWFQASEGPLVYKTVPAGDFVVTATVHARKTSNGSVPPDGIYSLGGLMARHAGTPEDYVFIVIGRDGNDVSIEHKSTDDNNSTYDGPSWPNGDAELRICRVGTQMRLYKRAVGAGSWTMALSIQRTDLAGELQVGAIAYANNPSPDLTVSFDEILFAAPAAGDCP